MNTLMPAQPGNHHAPLAHATAWRVCVGLATLALGLFTAGCTLVSTGARSAIVVLIRTEITAPGDEPLPKPARSELAAALRPHRLWLADDKRAAQWIAYVRVSPPATPLQPFGLAVVEVKKNPAWAPLAVSDPAPGRYDSIHQSLREHEDFERRAATEPPR